MAIKLVETTEPPAITAELVALAGVSFSCLRTHGDNVYVCCRDPQNKGKSYILKLQQGDDSVVPVTTKEHNVRSAVHEYGGGSFCVYEGGVIYTDFPSHILYLQTHIVSEPPQLLVERKDCRFADFNVYNNDTLFAIMEDHTEPEPNKVKNSLVRIDLNTRQLTIVQEGHDFYSCPQPFRDYLAYIAWDHPNMPWDTTMLYIHSLSDDNEPPIQIIMDQPCSMAEPCWNADGSLYFLSDVTGWHNIYRRDYQTGQVTCVLQCEADFASPHQGWILGEKSYIVDDDHFIVTASARDGLIRIHPNGAVTSLSSPCSSISDLAKATGDHFYYIGGSTKEPFAIYRYDSHHHHTRVHSSIADHNTIAPLQSFLVEPEHISYPSLGGRTAYAYLYRPTTTSSHQQLPPLLVKAHGGPTSQTSTTFRLDLQYWTSRGFCVLDVNYGGSTGYGKDYRRSLNGQWGLADVEDVCAGATYCVSQRWVHPDWLAIDGKSAGGYTTLCALVFGNVFHAGASWYGISNLVTLYQDTHKFESRYMDTLVGRYPDEKQKYEARCPIHFHDKLHCPLILLQGLEDKVVPHNQAETMYEVLRAKGLDTTLVLYRGEQHGFRKGENMVHALESEYSFFCQVFGIEAVQGTIPIDVGVRIEM
jgi:dipeptidyl aminopeptidase/acylaminoacyl peptidase